MRVIALLFVLFLYAEPGNTTLGGLTPGRPEKLNNRTFSRLLQKSCVVRKSRFLVLSLMVNTMGSLNKSRVTVSSPPGVLKSSTGLLHFPCALLGRSRRLGGRGQSPFSFFLGRSTLPSATLGHKTAHPPFSGTKVSYEINTNMIYPGPG